MKVENIMSIDKRHVVLSGNKLVLYVNDKKTTSLPAFTELKTYTVTDLKNFKSLFDMPIDLIDKCIEVSTITDKAIRITTIRDYIIDNNLDAYIRTGTSLHGTVYGEIKYNILMWLGMSHGTNYTNNLKENHVACRKYSLLSSGEKTSIRILSPELRELAKWAGTNTPSIEDAEAYQAFLTEGVPNDKLEVTDDNDSNYVAFIFNDTELELVTDEQLTCIEAELVEPTDEAIALIEAETV